MKTQIRNTLALATIMAAAFAGVARADNRATTGAVLPDQEIAKLINHRLEKEKIAGVHVSVEAQTVTLAGRVPSVGVEQEAVQTAGKADDVRRVVDRLSIEADKSDKAIADAAARQVRHYVFYTIFDNVNLAVKNGVVTLTGDVQMPYRATEIANLVAHVPGVREVDNKIATLPVSTFDDQLRYTIASRIYRDPDFWNYSLGPNPPIHVVVDNGHVTLAGAVNSEADKVEAGMIARTTFGVFSVNNDLSVDAG